MDPPGDEECSKSDGLSSFVVGLGEEMYEEGEWDEFEDDFDEFEDVALHCDRLGYRATSFQGASVLTMETKVSNVEPMLLPLPEILTMPLASWNERRKDEPYLIVPGLYLGAESHAKHEYMLTRLGVTHVLGIHENAKRHFPQSFDYCIFPLKDRQETDISLVFKDAHSYINKALENNGTVFVHCWAGMSRSATLVITFLMQREKISFNDAYKRVASAKPDIRPNDGFIFQMRQFEKQLGINADAKNAARNSSRHSERQHKPHAKLALSQPSSSSSSNFLSLAKSPKAQRGGKRRNSRT